MNVSQTVNEIEAFHATPRRREKPTVSLTDVCIYSRGNRAAPVDLFDAIFKGPFTATGTYIASPDSSLKSKVPSPCSLRVSDINKYAVEEDNQMNPPSVKIYFEGTIAWYEIVAPTEQYQPILEEMRRKASIWLWIQHRRLPHCMKSSKRPTWPSFKQLQRLVPPYLNSGDDPLEKYHPYLIERIIQSHLSGETLAVGPEGVDPKWFECQLAIDLETNYPAIWRSIYDRVDNTFNLGPQIQESLPEPISPKSLRAKVQKPSKETRHLLHLFLYLNVDAIKKTSNLAEASEIMIELLDLSDEWQSFTPLELFEKFECHAEALLTDSTFLSTLEGWPGLQELKSFTNQNWWRRRSRAQQRQNQPRQRQPSQESCTGSQSMDTISFDLTQEQSNLEAETAAIEFHGKIGRKGTSSLRPRLSSVLHTPGTPTRHDDSDSDILDVGKVSSDDECQIIEPKKNLSSDFKTKSFNKRILGEDQSANASKRPRKTRNEAATRNPRNQPSIPFKFGRGRPALTTVPIAISTNAQQTTTFRCHFPRCTYVKTCAGSAAAKAEIDKHHSLHRTEIRDALDMLKDPFIIGGRVGGEKGNRLVRPIGGIDHIVERIEEMAKGLGSTPSKRLVIS